jgi:hypothetical protein
VESVGDPPPPPQYLKLSQLFGNLKVRPPPPFFPCGTELKWGGGGWYPPSDQN